MKVQTYPRIWQNKKTKKKVRVMPWWETMKDGEIEQVDDMGRMFTEMSGRLCKWGVLVQIGYLLENEHGVWFGVGPGAEKGFKDLGEETK